MARRVAAAQGGGNLSRAEWMLRRLDEEGQRLTGRRELVVQAIAAKPGSFTPEALVGVLRRQEEEDQRLAGRRGLVVQAIAAKPGFFTPAGPLDEERPHSLGRATV